MESKGLESNWETEHLAGQHLNLDVEHLWTETGMRSHRMDSHRHGGQEDESVLSGAPPPQALRSLGGSRSWAC